MSERRREAALIFVVAITLVPIVDTIAKALTAELDPRQVAWGRYAFAVVVLAPFMFWRFGPNRALRPNQPWLQGLRGLALTASTLFFFWGVSAMPLADTLALAFTYPLIITLAAPFVLGETFSLRRLALAAIGFFGAMLVIKPELSILGLEHGASLGIEALGGLGAGLSFAIYALASRKLAGVDPPILMLFWGVCLGLVVTTLFAAPIWRAPDAVQWGGFAAMGLLSGLAHYLLLLAFDRADASFLAPIGYFELLIAALLGLLVFGDFPDPIALLGMAAIVASGVATLAKDDAR